MKEVRRPLQYIHRILMCEYRRPQVGTTTSMLGGLQKCRSAHYRSIRIGIARKPSGSKGGEPSRTTTRRIFGITRRKIGRRSGLIHVARKGPVDKSMLVTQKSTRGAPCMKPCRNTFPCVLHTTRENLPAGSTPHWSASCGCAHIFIDFFSVLRLMYFEVYTILQGVI